MALKDIFLHADSSADFKVRLESAVNLAVAHEAHLTAVYVPELPKEQPRERLTAHPAVPAELLGKSSRRAAPKAHRSRLVSDAYERVRETSERARELFARQAGRAGVAHSWVYDEAPLADALALHARFCDVLVVTQPARKARTEHQILTLGLPVLMVPNKGRFAGIGQRIMVAWDRSPVALRAVNNARPFLREALDVKVLSVNLEPIYRGAATGSGIIEHLARHDIKATRLRVTEENARLSDVILSTAAKEKVDLIVMGAYGKRGLRERILGGVTSYVVSDTTVPLLLTH